MQLLLEQCDIRTNNIQLKQRLVFLKLLNIADGQVNFLHTIRYFLCM